MFVLLWIVSCAATIDVIGYYGNSGNDVADIPTIDQIDGNYNVVILTFANFQSGGSIEFDIQGPYAKNITGLAADILRWKQGRDQHGRKRLALFSIGGENGNWPAAITPAELTAGITTFMAKMNLDGFDIDLEASAVSGASTLAPVIKTFVAQGKTVTAAPEAAQASLVAYKDILASLSWVHPQFYNNGPNAVTTPFLPDPAVWPKPWTITDWQTERNSTAFWGGVLGAIGAASNLQPAQFGMLIPATPAAAGSYNHWDIAKLKQEVVWAKARHVGCWAMAYDHGNNYAFAKAMGSINDDLAAYIL